MSITKRSEIKFLTNLGFVVEEVDDNGDIVYLHHPRLNIKGSVHFNMEMYYWNSNEGDAVFIYHHKRIWNKLSDGACGVNLSKVLKNGGMKKRYLNRFLNSLYILSSDKKGVLSGKYDYMKLWNETARSGKSLQRIGGRKEHHYYG